MSITEKAWLELIPRDEYYYKESHIIKFSSYQPYGKFTSHEEFVYWVESLYDDINSTFPPQINLTNEEIFILLNIDDIVNRIYELSEIDDSPRTNYLYRYLDRNNFSLYYIGITGDPIARDQEHRRRNDSRFDRYLKENPHLTMDVIFGGLTRKESLLFEELAIAFYKLLDCDLLNVLDGGEANPMFNEEAKTKFLQKIQSPEYKEKLSKAQSKRQADVNNRHGASEKNIHTWKNNTEVRARHLNSVLKSWEDEERRKNASERMKEKWSQSEYRENICNKLDQHWNEERRKLQSAKIKRFCENNPQIVMERNKKIKEYWNDENVRKERSKKTKASWTTERKQNRSESMKKTWSDKEFKEKLSLIHKSNQTHDSKLNGLKARGSTIYENIAQCDPITGKILKVYKDQIYLDEAYGTICKNQVIQRRIKTGNKKPCYGYTWRLLNSEEVEESMFDAELPTLRKE